MISQDWDNYSHFWAYGRNVLIDKRLPFNDTCILVEEYFKWCFNEYGYDRLGPRSPFNHQLGRKIGGGVQVDCIKVYNQPKWDIFIAASDNDVTNKVLEVLRG